jgi:uncharacterized protein
MKPLVIYHAGCWDGFCAAWVARSALGECEFVPTNYGEQPPEVTGRDVFILDFSFPRPVMLAMLGSAKSLLCLDHHKTAEEALRGLDFCRFDMNKSGARLTWEHFYPDTKSPWLVDYTEDRDLWLWELPRSRAINASLRTHPLDFELWDKLGDDLRGFAVPNVLAVEGEAILRSEEQIVRQHVHNAQETTIDGHRVLIVNATCYVSEIAGSLANRRPFGVVWFEGDDNERVYSLRSDENGIDVSEIAKAHGGGGHARAAGFRVAATGATGVFTHGQLQSNDEGELKVEVAVNKEAEVVTFDFGKPVAWLAIPKGPAMALAAMIESKASQLQ